MCLHTELDVCRFRQLSQHGDSRREIHTRVGDALAVDELMAWNRKRLLAGDEVALDHHAHKAGVSCANLGSHAAERAAVYESLSDNCRDCNQP